MTLTDASGIPLTKLGSQALELELPVPEALRGHGLRAAVLDRNGQMKSVAVERTALDDGDVLYIDLDYVSMIGIWSTE